MRFNQLQRDPDTIKGILKEMDDGSIVVTDKCHLYVPLYWESHGLVEIAEQISLVGIYALVYGKKYALSIVSTIFNTNPSSVSQIETEDGAFYEFEYEPGDILVANKKVVKNDKLLYTVFEQMIYTGKTPAFMNYKDLGRLFDTDKSHGGVQLTATPTTMHLVLAQNARNPEDKTQYFRQVTNGKDFDKVSFINLESSFFAGTNTTTKMIGSYFDDNINSALNRPAEKSEDIEEHLRG